MRRIWTAEESGVNWIAIEDRPWWWIWGTRKRRYWSRAHAIVWHDSFDGDKLCPPKQCAELKALFDFNKHRTPLDEQP